MVDTSDANSGSGSTCRTFPPGPLPVGCWCLTDTPKPLLLWRLLPGAHTLLRSCLPWLLVSSSVCSSESSVCNSSTCSSESSICNCSACSSKSGVCNSSSSSAGGGGTLLHFRP